MEQATIFTAFTITEVKRGLLGEQFDIKVRGSGQAAVIAAKSIYPKYLMVLRGFFVEETFVPFRK